MPCGMIAPGWVAVSKNELWVARCPESTRNRGDSAPFADYWLGLDSMDRLLAVLCQNRSELDVLGATRFGFEGRTKGGSAPKTNVNSECRRRLGTFCWLANKFELKGRLKLWAARHPIKLDLGLVLMFRWVEGRRTKGWLKEWGWESGVGGTDLTRTPLAVGSR